VSGPEIAIVIPTTGRASLGRLLAALRAEGAPRVIVVDDRGSGPPLDAPAARVIRGPARGPAAARNAGWRAARASWIAFLDDDVVPPPGWLARLRDDLAGLAPGAAASQGRVSVPLPGGRRPTDWERNVAGLEGATWATADMAFRREALEAVGGFDERFPRAYREDADLGLRLVRAGWRIARGQRVVEHPVGQAGRWVSVRKQAGNADDVLMRALHGPRWRQAADAPPGRLCAHLATAGAGVAAAVLALTGHGRAAGAAAALWAAGTGELAWRRIAPGPRTPDEVATMLATSAALPFAATGWWLAGHATLRRRLRAPRGWGLTPSGSRGPAAPGETGRGLTPPPEAVLLDRDGTLVVDVPYNGDPARVRPMPGAREALDRLRAAGVRLAVVSNQSGIARGTLTREQVDAVNRRVEELLGPVGPWLVCPHGPDDGCGCRKPAPGLVLQAAQRLGVAPERCAVVGDIGADVQAARTAGARGVLVPTPQTLPAEVHAAEEVAPDLRRAVDLLLGAPA
jgi:histidinol-phosphate phosphatase family protein